MHRTARRAIAAALLASAGGCSDYLDRRDTLTLESGEAVQANIARQVIDPWPRQGRSVERTHDGERLQHAIERYRNPQASGGLGAAVPPPAAAPVGEAPVAR